MSAKRVQPSKASEKQPASPAEETTKVVLAVAHRPSPADEVSQTKHSRTLTQPPAVDTLTAEETQFVRGLILQLLPSIDDIDKATACVCDAMERNMLVVVYAGGTGTLLSVEADLQYNGENIVISSERRGSSIQALNAALHVYRYQKALGA